MLFCSIYQVIFKNIILVYAKTLSSMSFNIRNNKCYLSTKSAYQNDNYNEMANTVIYF